MLASGRPVRLAAGPKSANGTLRQVPCRSCPFKRVVAATAPTQEKKLIEKLGGPETITMAVELFYSKVLADDRIKDYFAGTDMQKQRAHQAAFMTYACGGPNLYKGKDLAEAHRHLVPHLNENHFNAVAENFAATLQELGVPQSDVDAAVQIVASTKDQVLAE